MSEARIPRLPIAEAKAAAAPADLPEMMAELSIFRVLLRHPQLAKALNDLLSMLLWNARLEPRLRELIIMRIGWVTGSVYEWTQHWRVARLLGVPEEDLLAVRDWQAARGLGSVERAVLRATDETMRDGAISPDGWQALRDQLGDEPEVLLEVVAAIGCWQMIAGLLRSLEIPLEDGVEPWPPDGAGPDGAGPDGARPEGAP